MVKLTLPEGVDLLGKVQCISRVASHNGKFANRAHGVTVVQLMRVRWEPKKPLEWCIELTQPMNTALPTQKTKQPSRSGLLFHEILADGFIHAAVVFGIEQDVRFVERVANLAWSNGVQMVKTDVPRTATLVQHLCEGLEFGRSDAQALCNAVAAAVGEQQNPFEAIRSHYETVLGSRALSASNPSDAGAIRQIVGEAVVAGLSSRGLAPDLYQAVAEFNDRARLEQQFLSEMLPTWANGDGLPPCHPFLQMAERFYHKTPNERQLLVELMGRALLPALESKDPWALSYWLNKGWRAGVIQAKFAPDAVQAVFSDAAKEHIEYCRQLYRDCITATTDSEGKLHLVTAFERYIAESNDCNLSHEQIRTLNPRILAARAFDFTIWMGFLSELPAASGDMRGAA